MPSVMSLTNQPASISASAPPLNRAGTLDEMWELGKGVVAGGDDDVDAVCSATRLHERDVAPIPASGEVDDSADPGVDEVVHANDDGGDVTVGVEAFDVGVVDDELVAQDEHVLVHEHLAEVASVNRAANGLDVGHGPTLRRSGEACSGCEPAGLRRAGRGNRARLSRITVLT